MITGAQLGQATAPADSAPYQRHGELSAGWRFIGRVGCGRQPHSASTKGERYAHRAAGSAPTGAVRFMPDRSDISIISECYRGVLIRKRPLGTKRVV